MIMLYAKIFRDDGQTICYYIVRMYEDRDGGDNIIIRVESEQAQEHFAEFRLPDNYCYTAFGFSEDEIDDMRKYLLHNAPLIWDMAREGRENIA